MNFLKNHPFAVEAFFDSSLVLTYALPKAQLQGFIPEHLQLDTFQDQWAFVAVAMVQTRDLRPRNFPRFMGNDFFLIGYRVFVRYTDRRGKSLRGLYILKSETDKRKMAFFGNLFTHYNYSAVDVQQTTEGAVRRIASRASGLKIALDTGPEPAPLPAGSPFADWKEARRYAGPLPFTFTWNAAEKTMLIIEGVRQNWEPQPVRLLQAEVGFLKERHLENAVAANAFEIKEHPLLLEKRKAGKMEMNRTPFQGLRNILVFNRHFYWAAGLAFVSVLLFRHLLPLQWPVLWLAGLAFAGIAVSLAVSWYVYDVSGIYRMPWLRVPAGATMLNIHAGFDETSALLRKQFPGNSLTICDFYDPARHTEISIRRARKAFPPAAGTISVSTEKLPFADGSFDVALVFLSAHEIRKPEERAVFFRELRRLLRPGGRLYVTEHLRDLPNFAAYNIGFFHFHSRATWLRAFSEAGLTLRQEIKDNSFIRTFILASHGDTL